MTVPDPDLPVLLTVYGREHCHLCQDMLAALQELKASHPFQLEVVDVDSDSDLQSRYGQRVPVLMAGDSEICHYHLDLNAFDRIFQRI
ncbi:glutaredoxin family protein [Nitrosospira multiformis]|uniref:Glutaredoxin 2 n=1 Tax=Nitrosospira multiformis (strain ATCC 25196 / NCIMB 11849 / C 71) TaxID=323848 RepID=Q2Y874_NITMU|nr:glutaredoxin family protein [Nitrosospira multiformis]ABB75047.1 Glutaredoxin 2 [Nitrosospira multiformis ATCC 25196]SEA55573.1 Glutaredoxin-like domain [Nitrosospira multiformis]SEF83920.1 Glutaredoxin-like domain [Nitrosospira multiformis ATCC 25196]